MEENNFNTAEEGLKKFIRISAGRRHTLWSGNTPENCAITLRKGTRVAIQYKSETGEDHIEHHYRAGEQPWRARCTQLQVEATHDDVDFDFAITNAWAHLPILDRDIYVRRSSVGVAVVWDGSSRLPAMVVFEKTDVGVDAVVMFGTHEGDSELCVLGNTAGHQQFMVVRHPWIGVTTQNPADMTMVDMKVSLPVHAQGRTTIHIPTGPTPIFSSDRPCVMLVDYASKTIGTGRSPSVSSRFIVRRRNSGGEDPISRTMHSEWVGRGAGRNDEPSSDVFSAYGVDLSIEGGFDQPFTLTTWDDLASGI